MKTPKFKKAKFKPKHRGNPGAQLRKTGTMNLTQEQIQIAALTAQVSEANSLVDHYKARVAELSTSVQILSTQLADLLNGIQVQNEANAAQNEAKQEEGLADAGTLTGDTDKAS